MSVRPCVTEKIIKAHFQCRKFVVYIKNLQESVQFLHVFILPDSTMKIPYKQRSALVKTKSANQRSHLLKYLENITACRLVGNTDRRLKTAFHLILIGNAHIIIIFPCKILKNKTIFLMYF